MTTLEVIIAAIIILFHGFIFAFLFWTACFKNQITRIEEKEIYWKGYEAGYQAALHALDIEGNAIDPRTLSSSDVHLDPKKVKTIKASSPLGTWWLDHECLKSKDKTRNVMEDQPPTLSEQKRETEP